MRAWLTLSILAAAFLLAPVSAQETGDGIEAPVQLLEDPAGDVAIESYDQQTSPPAGLYEPVDLRGLALLETPDAIQFSVSMEAFSDCQAAGQCPDSGDTRTRVDVGDASYILQTGIGLTAAPYAFWHAINPDNEYQFLTNDQLQVTTDPETATITAMVPRDLMLDDNGAPVRTGTIIGNLHTTAYSMTSFGGPDLDDPFNGAGENLLVVTDTMGFGEEGSYEVQTGGVFGTGSFSVDSPLPFRASNGGEATFRYDLLLDAPPGDYTVMIVGMDETWKRHVPDSISAPGVPVTFNLFVETPFGHQHGGLDRFQLVVTSVDDPDAMAGVELGVHYLRIPQPSGHHPEMWFHARTGTSPFETAFDAGFGGTARLVMNTDSEAEDTGGAQAGGAPPPFDQDNVFVWNICLDQELLLGIDVNLTQTGEVTLVLTSGTGRSYNDLTITGRVVLVEPGEPLGPCFYKQYRGRDTTVIATFEETTASVSGTTSVTLPVLPEAAGDYVPFVAGRTMALEIEATGSEPTDTGGPGSLALTSEGSILLPLDEYFDERPPGLVGDAEEDEVSDDEVAEATQVEDEVEESPMAGIGAFLVVSVAAVVARRR